VREGEDRELLENLAEALARGMRPRPVSTAASETLVDRQAG